MSDTSWLTRIDISGDIGFTTSLISNSCLILMIAFRSSKQMGSYKNLMIVFCFFTLFHASVIMLSRSLVHSYDNTLFLIHRKRFDLGKTATRLISTLYCGCYAQSFSLAALLFIHRYTATCKSEYLYLFDGWRILLWVLGAASISIFWASAAFFLFAQTERTDQSFNYIIRTYYALDPYWTDYVPYKYFYYDENGDKLPDAKNMMGIFQHLIIISISFVVVFYCGIATYKTMNQYKGISSKTRNLQYQLFRALVVQTLFPMVFVYMPAGFLLLTPFIGLEFGAETNSQAMLTQLYPAVDPIIFILLVSDYRETLIRILCLKGKDRRVSLTTSSNMMTIIASK